MFTGILQKTQQPFYIRELRRNFADIRASLNLQESVLEPLGENQTLIHKQNAAGFARRFDGIHGVTLGVFVKDKNGQEQLIAQQTLELSPDKGIPLPEQLSVSRGELGCISGFMVHPNFRGNHLTDMLLDCLQEWGRTSFGKKGFLSMADAANPFSYNVLMNRGYAIVSAYIDSADNGKTYAFLNHPTIEHNRHVEVEELPHNLFKEVSSILNHRTEPALIKKREPIIPIYHLCRERAVA